MHAIDALPSPTRTTDRAAAATAIALALLAMLPYLARGVPGTFIDFDDGSYIVDNPAVRAGLSAAGVRWAFTTFHVANWHPLTWLSHMLDVTLFGLNARGHHLTNILIHGVNTALLFLALVRLTGRRWPSALAAALFGAHPLHVESVAWVAERKDLLAGLFFMLVLLAWERFVRRGAEKAQALLLVIALLALGLMAKPMLVTVPFVLLLLDVWPLGRLRFAPGGTRGVPSPSRFFVEKLPLFALAAVSSTLTVIAQHSSGAVVAVRSIGTGLRVANALTSYAAYLGKTFWPLGLAVYYPYPFSGIPWVKTGAALVLLASLTAATVRQARVRPYLALGWCWFLGMLMPVIGLVQVGEQAMADRYTYLPLIGVFIAIAWWAASLVKVRLIGPAVPIICAAAIAACLALSVSQAGTWTDSETLFRRAIAVTGDNRLAHNNLGSALHAQGRHAEALQHFEEALRIAPTYEQAMRNSGVALFDLGRVPQALEKFRQSVGLVPGDAKARFYLGQALESLGRDEEALREFDAALRSQLDLKTTALVYLGIGNALIRLNRTVEAAAALERALDLDPGNNDAAYNLGALRLLAGRSQEALDLFAAVLARSPENADARGFLAVALVQLGRAAEAALEYETLARTRPQDAEIRYNFGLALRLAGREDQALAAFREALRLDPGFAAAAAALAGR